MPTSLPTRRHQRTSRLIIFFVLSFAASLVFIEIADPAPMDIDAAWIASP